MTVKSLTPFPSFLHDRQGKLRASNVDTCQFQHHRNTHHCLPSFFSNLQNSFQQIQRTSKTIPVTSTTSFRSSFDLHDWLMRGASRPKANTKTESNCTEITSSSFLRSRHGSDDLAEKLRLCAKKPNLTEICQHHFCSRLFVSHKTH